MSKKLNCCIEIAFQKYSIYGKLNETVTEVTFVIGHIEKARVPNSFYRSQKRKPIPKHVTIRWAKVKKVNPTFFPVRHVLCINDD